MLSFFPRGVLDEILNLIESVSEDFPSYSLLLLLQLLVAHKVSRSTFHGNIYAFYFDNEHLYRFSPCRTFMVVRHLGAFGAPLNVRHFFLSSILSIFR